MKRIINIFLHNIREFKRNKKNKYKIRFIIFSIVFISILSFGIFSLIKSFSSYYSKANLSLDIQTAMFVLDEGEMSFNIDIDQIIPKDEPYIYTFSVSNFNEERKSDVDLKYNLKIQTTTNMPLEYRLYYKEYNLDEKDIITRRDLLQDEDSSWYNLLTVGTTYEFSYTERTTNIYYLVIDFPTVYKDVIEYSDAIENIEVIIDSEQIV